MHNSSVSDYLKLLFPNGTDPFTHEDGSGARKTWSLLPHYAPDLFAATASLVRASGAYQYLRISPAAKDDPFNILSDSARSLNIRLAASYACILPRIPKLEVKPELQAELIENAREIFKLDEKWKPLKRDQAEITKLWGQLARCQDPIQAEHPPERTGKPPAWWSPAMRLMIIADEASKGIGFNARKVDFERADGTIVPRQLFTAQTILFTGTIVEGLDDDPSAIQERTRSLSTITARIDRALVSVLPKTRTAQVGCTIRTMSHHLALLTSQGRLQTNWYVTRERPVPSVSETDDGKQLPLNLLLVPFPFGIRSVAFAPESKDERHSSFSMKQHWLGRAVVRTDDFFELERMRNRNEEENSALSRAQALADFVQSLMDDAEADGKPVNGIVFPELSLTGPLHDFISEKLFARPKNWNNLEFIVSGTSSRKVERDAGAIEIQHGNFVSTRGILKTEKDPDRKIDIRQDASQKRVLWDYRSERAKHHRWCITASQSQAYGLANQLDPNSQWWEDIPIGARTVDVFEPRAGSSMTVLICEDLARVDPCQDAVRALGPNLVLALLMDGPQVRGRWPANYAGVLADDPGASVLTVTSLGLINRAAPSAPSDSRAIAYWRSPNRETSLTLPPGEHGLVASLTASCVTERTLDGRIEPRGAYVWALDDCISVRADDAASSAFLN